MRHVLFSAAIVLTACGTPRSAPPEARRPPSVAPREPEAAAAPTVRCSVDGGARAPALTAVMLRGSTNAAICGQLHARAGAPLDEVVVESDIRALVAGTLVDDVVAVVEESPGAAPTLVFEVKERPRLMKVDARGTPEGVDAAAAVGPLPGHFDPTWIRAAKARFVDALKWEGYRKATVDHVVTPVRDGGVAVSFVVKPEKRYTFGAVRFEGLERAPEVRVRDALGVRAGAPAQDLVIERDTYLITAVLYDLGMVHGEVRARVTENFLGASIDVVYTVNEGPVFRLSAVKVAGAHALPGARYAAIVKKLRRGDVFARSKVARAIEEIEALHREAGDPRKVQVETQLDMKKHVIDLVLRVE